MYESIYHEERNALIKRLTTLYPYPEKWFEYQKTSVLLALCYGKSKKYSAVKPPALALREVRRTNIYGDSEVLADNGEWEIEID